MTNILFRGVGVSEKKQQEREGDQRDMTELDINRNDCWLCSPETHREPHEMSLNLLSVGGIIGGRASSLHWSTYR